LPKLNIDHSNNSSTFLIPAIWSPLQTAFHWEYPMRYR